MHVAAPQILADVPGSRVWSGIAKQPVAPEHTLWLSLTNLSGDGQADLTVHGGPDKAVYTYPSEHLPQWLDELDHQPLGPAPFGESLSTAGALETDVRIGDIWTWGDATLQVSQPRWPCFKLVLHRQQRDIQVRMRRHGWTGWYLRVLEQGEVPAGGRIEVAHQDPHTITVTDAHLAMGDIHLDAQDRLERVAAHPALAPQWRDPLLERLSRH